MTDDKKAPHFSDGSVTEGSSKPYSVKDRNLISTLISEAKERVSGVTPQAVSYTHLTLPTTPYV